MSGKYHELTITAEVRACQAEQYGASLPPAEGLPDQPLGALEREFIEARDSFYMATIGASGWPYLQHRGGPKGFLQVLDDHTLAFADLTGNRRLVSRGNLRGDDRIALFLMDYPGRRRLKVMGRASFRPVDDELLATLRPEIAPATVEGSVVIHVVAHDWNCPKHIRPRYDRDAVDEHVAELGRRIAELEAKLARTEG
ncbi:MAG: pyridoxamine 5'-phosphate oxidase family protein [Planctomycetes bacterium]|nr:pyridoxamine 5'-phosphate oxidase family protein [Planctomycetota bacterium]